MQRQFSAGGVVYKRIGEEILFLVAKSTVNAVYTTSGDWRLPKGWVDDEEKGGPGPKTLGVVRASEEEMQQSALREVREEGGVEAEIQSFLGYDKFFFVIEGEKVMKTVKYYLMRFENELPGGFGEETEEVKWLKKDEAMKILGKRKGEAKLIEEAEKIIKNGNL